MPRRAPAPLPGWVASLVEPGDVFDAERAVVDTAVEIAVESARHGGGPFGALIVDDALTVVDVGWNHVVEARDSTAHAEVHAIRRAQGRLDTHDLGASERGSLSLFASCAPCIQCFGAVYWSGVSRVVAAASTDAAEALGFDEGPVSDALWAKAKAQKGVTFARASGSKDANEPFRVYKELGGIVY